MMKFNKTLYVENDDRMVYQLVDIELHGNGLAYLYLDLVCGYDYVDPDNSSIQGYVPANNFVDEVQHEMVSCDILAESMLKALENDGYRILKTLPKTTERN